MLRLSRLLVLFCFLLTLAACISKVQPILKPAERDIPTRIADQQKEIDDAITAGHLTRDHAKPLQKDVNRIGEEYAKLQAEGGLSPTKTDALNRKLDDSSDRIFRARQAGKKAKTPFDSY